MSAAAEPKLVGKTYQVADLLGVDSYVVPPGIALRKLVPAPESKKEPEHWLIQLITDEVAPASWSQRGGPGTIDYFPLGQALIVNATAPVQEKVAELLRQLHDTKDLNVSVEVRIVGLPPIIAQRIAQYSLNPRPLDEHGRPLPSVTYLDDYELFLTLECCLAPEVIHVPKLTMANGQTGSLQMEDYQWFVTNVQVVQLGRSVIFVPTNHPAPVGIRLVARPLIARNRRSLSLKLKAQMTSVAAVHLAPITSFITPVFEGGAQGQPVPFTQFVQIPEMNRLEVDQHLIMNEGQTAVINGWQFKHERERTLIRWLREVPIVEELLRPTTDAEIIVGCLEQVYGLELIPSWLMTMPVVQKWLQRLPDCEFIDSWLAEAPIAQEWLEAARSTEFISHTLHRIPLVQEWSKPVRETRHIIVLVTPRILREAADARDANGHPCAKHACRGGSAPARKKTASQ